MRTGMVLGIVLSLVLVNCERSFQDAPEPVEEFRVAEPLASETEAALRQQLQTITAVTEPYDEVEAAMEQEAELPLAKTRHELEQQCVTAIKELAFCTNEDAFLDIIASGPSLQSLEDRDRFMRRVQGWFEPGGVRVDCKLLLAEEEARQEEARRMWQRTAGATEKLCTDFGAVLVEADAFRWIASLWQTAEHAD